MTSIERQLAANDTAKEEKEDAELARRCDAFLEAASAKPIGSGLTIDAFFPERGGSSPQH